MKRLTRIALILLASGTLMVFLAQKRLAVVEEIHASDGKFTNLENDIQMSLIGRSAGSLMIATGLGLTVTAALRNRKTQTRLASHG